MKLEGKNLSVIKLLVSVVLNVIVTAVTVISLGMKIHKDILNDVTTQQQKAILDLQEKLTIEINNKLNKEPTTFQVSKQDKAIESLQNDIKEVDNKLIALQTSVNSITSLLKKKIDLTIK